MFTCFYKKTIFPLQKNPVNMDTSEIRLPDGTLMNAEKSAIKIKTLSHNNPVIF